MFLLQLFLLLASCANSPIPIRLVERTLAEHKVKVYTVRRCALVDMTSTKGLSDGGIEVVKVHQLTWRAFKIKFLYIRWSWEKIVQ